MATRPPTNIIAVFNTTCNYRCRFCSHSLPGNLMECWSYNDITTLLDDLWNHSELNNIGGCGEITALPFFETITYEELVEDWAGTARRVYDYLGLSWDDPVLRTYQQENRPIDRIIKDYPSVVKKVRSMPRTEEVRNLLWLLESPRC